MSFDPNFDLVRALLHCDDFSDVYSQMDATQVGSPTIDTGDKKFGSGSLLVSSGNYLTLPDSSNWDFGYSDFTVEFWFKPTTTNANCQLIGQFGTNPKWGVYTDGTGHLYFSMTTEGGYTYSTWSANTILTLNVWRSICVTRTDGYIRVYVDGTQAVSAYSFNYDLSGSTNVLTIGNNCGTAYFDEIRVTKTLSRYGTLYNYDVQTEPFPDADHNIYTEVVAEGVLFAEGVTLNGVQHIASIDDIGTGSEAFNTVEYPIIEDAFNTLATATVIDGQIIADSGVLIDSANAGLVAILIDIARVVDSVGVGSRWSVAVQDAAKVAELLAAGVPVAVDDAATVAWALTVVQGVKIADKIGVKELLSYPVRFGLSLRDTIKVHDALTRFLHAEIADAGTVDETVLAVARFFAELEDDLTIEEDVGTYFILSVEAHDEGVFDDSFDIRMIFDARIAEQLAISALIVEPNGGITTWAVNTRTGAVTEYENYAFNSFAQSGFHYLGASADGLFALDGTDDAGTPTIAHLKSGYAQFGGSRYVSFKAAYIGMRAQAGSTIYLKLETGDGKTYLYKTVVQDQQSTKVRFGKGLRARYFRFELMTEGQDFDLDTIEFVPLVATRRV